eukprot:6206917-Pleurochrysis_carterae.AAC.1
MKRSRYSGPGCKRKGEKSDICHCATQIVAPTTKNVPDDKHVHVEYHIVARYYAIAITSTISLAATACVKALSIKAKGAAYCREKVTTYCREKLFKYRVAMLLSSHITARAPSCWWRRPCDRRMRACVDRRRARGAARGWLAAAALPWTRGW